ncbi:MAG: GAF domain-containing protein [Candidatus Promineifilaceae bacterium]
MQAREHRLLALLQQISLAVAEADTVNAAFDHVLTSICEFMRWPLGHVYVWSDSTDVLVSSGIWYVMEGTQFGAFQELSEKTRFKLGEGTIGRVIATGNPVTVPDVRKDVGFVRQLPVDEGGIRAYFSFPVVLDNQVSAVLEFFSTETTVPNEDMTSVINHAGALLGLAIGREQMLIELQQSEARLTDAQHMAHVGSWEWDISRNKMTWSDELYRIYGISPYRLLGTYEDIAQYVHPDDREYLNDQFDRSIREQRSFDCFHRIIRADGTERVLHTSGRPIMGEKGSVLKLSGTAQDMTEQKEIELQLARKVRQLTALMTIGQTVAATLDLKLIYKRVLASLRPLLGAEALLLFIYQDGMLEIVSAEHEGVPDMIGQRIPIQKGIAGEVWRDGRSLILHGEACTQRLARELTEDSGYTPQAMLAVPVIAHQESIGVLEATHVDPAAFDTDDLRLLESAAVWTAIAVNNARQYENLQRRLGELDAIVAIDNAMIEALELDPVLQLIASHVQNIIAQAEWTTIHLLDPDANKLVLVASAGLDVSPDEYSLNVGEGVAGEVMADGKALNVADVQHDPRRLPIDLSIDAHSLLVAPVESRHRRLGTITVQCARPNTFTVEDERLLKMLGVQAGIAIDNSRMYESQLRARRRAELQSHRIRDMARRVVRAQEEERARISRELHDEAGQSLTSLAISLELIRSRLPDELSELNEDLQEVIDMTDGTLRNLRLLSHNLRPPGLDAYGLHAALEGLCQDVANHTSLQINYRGQDLPDLAPLAALSLYRFTQEALTNVAKHARAGEVWVTLWQDGHDVFIEVRDNGDGFSVPDLEYGLPGQGTGLAGMWERVEMVDGRLEIDSEPGKGTCLLAAVPYRSEGA